MRQNWTVRDHALRGLHPVPGGRVAQPWRTDPWTGTLDPSAHPCDYRLVTRWGAARCLTDGVMPWRSVGAATVILAVDTALFHRHETDLAAEFGDLRLALCPRPTTQAAVLALARHDLVAAAETRVPAAASCRTWQTQRLWRRAAILLAAVGTLGFAFPGALLVTLTGWCILTLAAGMALKLAALAIAIAPPVRRRESPGATPILARLPVVSILVPLYRERAIAQHLIERLLRLDYPRDRLDLCLIVEDNDDLTRMALEAAALPDWAQVVSVPQGTIRTKPRALNYALDFARGSIIGIYDAEDAPDPGQIAKVVARFAERGPQVACLQAALDYDDAGGSWIARCFTLEYAGWFRVLLPGLSRMGMVIPLGGTSLFLRREAIVAVGGWDAHNVTEDADLGIRLARHGYVTELIDSVTMEEANARAWPWVRQRSRWLKGYAMTWAVHTSSPRMLWRDLGGWRFAGLQILLLGTLTQFALAPLMWSFWLIVADLPHPLTGLLAPWVLVATAVLFALTEVVNLAIAWVGARRSGRRWLGLWAPLMQVYFPLATIAVYKGLWEILTCPYYWDKTAHGIGTRPRVPRHTSAPPAPWPRRA